MSRSRAIVLMLAIAGIAAFFLLGLDDYLDLDAIKRERMRLVGFWQSAPLATAAIKAFKPTPPSPSTATLEPA